MGLPFEGLTYPETTLLVTTLFPFQQHLEGISNVSYCWWVQPINATQLVVYRQGFQSPRSFVDVD
jgi:hypothetical protein